MKKKIETLLYKELDEIESHNFVTNHKHLHDKIAFIAHDIRNDFQDESSHLSELLETSSDFIKHATLEEIQEDFVSLKAKVAIILKQILEIDD